MWSAWLAESEPQEAPSSDNDAHAEDVAEHGPGQPAALGGGPPAPHPGWLDACGDAEDSDLGGSSPSSSGGGAAQAAQGARTVAQPPEGHAADALDALALVAAAAPAGAAADAMQLAIPDALPPVLQRWPAQEADDCLVAQGVRQWGPAAGVGDPAVSRIASSCFRLRYIKSLQDMASDAGVGEWKYKRMRTLLSSCLVIAERFMRRSFELMLAQACGVQRYMYIDMSMFDETPLVVREQDPGVAIGQDGAVQSALAVQQGGGAASAGQGARPHASSTVVGKVLQSSQSWAALLGTPGGRLLVIRGSTGNWMQLLERNTGECLHGALAANSGVSRHAGAFESCLRLAVTDGAGANDRAEQQMVRERQGWDFLQFHCEVHKVASCFKQCFGLAPLATKGALHFALAVRASGGAYRAFRDALREVIHSRLHFLRAPAASADAQQFRKKTIELFLPGPENCERRAVFDALCAGDWRNRDRIECVVVGLSSEEDASRAAAREHCVNDLVWALLPRQPGVYNESKWGGADLALQSLGLLHSFHGVLEATFAAWHGAMSAARPASEANLPALGDEVPAMRFAAGLADLGLEDNAPAPGSAADNERHRRVAKAWVESRSSFVLPALGIIVLPLSSLLRACLRVGGAKWEFEQRAKVASGDGTQMREYRVLLAAEGVLEDRFFTHLCEAFSPEQWEAVHPSHRTHALQALAFRMLSRAGGAVCAILQVPHTLLPLKAFRLLRSPEVAQELLDTPACLQDTWGATFLADHADDLTSEISLAKLSLIATLAKLDIAEIEVGHSRYRRALLNASSTWRQLFDDSSSDWVFRDYMLRARLCRRLCGQQGWFEELEQTPAGADSKEDRDRPSTAGSRRMRRDGKQRGGGGGAYRAFLRERQLPMFDSRTAEIYRSLPPEERARYESLGREMTDGHRARQAQGISTQSSARAGERLMAKRAFQHAVAERSVRQDAPTSLVVRAGGDCREARRTARRDRRVQSAADKVVSDQTTAVLRDAAQSRRNEASQSLAAVACPSVAGSPEFLGAAVSERFRSLEFFPDAKSMADKLVASASGSHGSPSFLHRLEDEWRKKHTTVSHATSPAIGAPTAKRTECQRAGMCLCRDPPFKRFVARMSAAFKAACPRGSPRRGLVNAGSMVLRLSPTTDGGARTDHFLHISFVSWSPYLFAGQTLRKVSQDGQTVELEATLNFSTMWRALEPIYAGCTSCTLQLFSIMESSSLATRLAPRFVKVREIGDALTAEASAFWPPRRAPRHRRAPPPAPAAKAPQAASSSSCSNFGLGNRGPPDGDVVGLGPDDLGSDDDNDKAGLADESGTEPSGDELEGLLECMRREGVFGDVDGPQGDAAQGDAKTGFPARPRSPSASGSSDSSAGAPAAADPLAAPPGLGEHGQREHGPDGLGGGALVPAAADVEARRADGEGAEKRRRLNLVPPECLMMLPNGSITWYEKGGYFVAECDDHSQQRPKCKRTRTAAPSKAHAGPQGRPLGYLAAYLMCCEGCADATAHYKAAAKVSFQQRREARRKLREAPGAALLFAKERPPREGEASEPEGCVG